MVVVSILSAVLISTRRAWSALYWVERVTPLGMATRRMDAVTNFMGLLLGGA
jgi:hypothetical protein